MIARAQLMRAVIALLSVALLSIAAAFTYSTFTDTTVNGENTFSAGKLGLRDNDASAPMFTVAGMGATETRERCIVVENAGNQTFDELRLYGSVSGALAEHLTLRVDRGTGATTFSDCGGFVPDASPTVYNGPLKDYPADWAGGIHDPADEWRPNQTATYRFRVSTNDAPQAAQGQQAQATFKWEARQGNEPPPAPSNRLVAGQSLTSGQSVFSPNRKYQLYMEPDGNLVLYEAGVAGIWAFDTFRHPGAYALMQADGNFVVWDVDGQALRFTATDHSPGSYLEVLDDGHVVIKNLAGTVIWMSG